MDASTTSGSTDAESAARDGRGQTVGGRCHVLFAFDVGFQIDLDRARELLHDGSPYRVMRGRRPSPAWFDYDPPPLRIVSEAGPVAVGELRTEPTTEWMIYEFGAILATHTLGFECTLEELTALSRVLDQDPALGEASRRGVETMLGVIRDAVERPEVKPLVEDYSIFVVDRWEEGTSAGSLLARNEDGFARVLQAETGRISRQQLEQTLLARMSYSPDDLVVVDWNGALVFDREAEDVVAVLKHANVELLELRVLDGQLDRLLDEADHVLAQLFRRRLWPSFTHDRMLRAFASVHTDAAVMFEGVNNAIKLLGNQYLARLYRMASDALDLPSWDASVLRKLKAADSVYQKMADTSAAQRMETLEIVIVVLIAVSILLMFVPGAGH